MAVGFSEIKFT